jgi:hypothetical protein
MRAARKISCFLTSISFSRASSASSPSSIESAAIAKASETFCGSAPPSMADSSAMAASWSFGSATSASTLASKSAAEIFAPPATFPMPSSSERTAFALLGRRSAVLSSKRASSSSTSFVIHPRGATDEAALEGVVRWAAMRSAPVDPGKGGFAESSSNNSTPNA